MKGLMQPTQLTINYLFDRAEKYHPDKSIITATATGIERTTYGVWADRTRRLATVLDQLVSPSMDASRRLHGTHSATSSCTLPHHVVVVLRTR